MERSNSIQELKPYPSGNNVYTLAMMSDTCIKNIHLYSIKVQVSFLRGQKRALNPLELELLEAVSSLGSGN